MPERIAALIGVTPDNAARIQRMFLDAGLIDQLVQPMPSSGLYKFLVPGEDAVQRLLFAASVNGLDAPLIHRYVDPSAKELEAAELLYLSAGGPGTQRGHPRAETSYDEASACAECGAGFVQTTPLVVRQTELPKSYLVTGIADDVILHDSVASFVASANLEGIAFREVLDAAGNAMPWHQLIVSAMMPPALATTRGIVRGRTAYERPCTQCGRDGWFDTTNDPFVPAYARQVLESMPSAAWMYELFSTGAWAQPIHGKRMLARRRLIVRPAVYRLLKSLKVRGVRFTPVRVD